MSSREADESLFVSLSLSSVARLGVDREEVPGLSGSSPADQGKIALSAAWLTIAATLNAGPGDEDYHANVLSPTESS